ncbi:SMB domain-containing protein [Caerostris extrusa]|uniref:SMB domain-containing protein n=1 Tax=Caerostris extrusa TaxID=172846 RepID=A0AAV4P4Q6_CAEEX|nr:SMB domain-containing protein [Caerostris extrusa]
MWTSIAECLALWSSRNIVVLKASETTAASGDRNNGSAIEFSAAGVEWHDDGSTWRPLGRRSSPKGVLRTMGSQLLSRGQLQEGGPASVRPRLRPKLRVRRPCARYRACCFDAEFRSTVSILKLRETERCIVNYAHESAYMVDTCGPRYAKDSLCTSNATDHDDPLLMIPVTSTVTGTTYRNFFCALCNEDTDAEHLEPWNLRVASWGLEVERSSLAQLKYNKAIKAWTLVEGNSSVTVYPTAMVPDSLRSTVVRCRGGLVDRCAHRWSDADVEARCNSYMSLVKDKKGLLYRNPYCAICNYVDMKDLDCINLPSRDGAGAGAVVVTML